MFGVNKIRELFSALFLDQTKTTGMKNTTQKNPEQPGYLKEIQPGC